jgi:hypothetical protein
MIVYLFDENGLYTSKYICQESPLEPGEYIIPTASLFDAPDIKSGFCPLAINGAWVNEEDHRGKIVYLTATGLPQEWTELGPLPVTVTEYPRPNQDYLWDGTAWVFNIELWREHCTCTAYQFRAALNELGKRQEVESTVVASASQDLKDAWEYGTTYERLSPYVLDMQAALGSTDAEVDAIFELAVTK